MSTALSDCGHLYFLEDSPYRKDLTVICVRNLDSGSGCGGMYYLAVADVDTYVTRVAYDITGLCVSDTADITSYASVSTGGVRQVDTEVPVYAHYEARAVGTAGERASAVYIRIADELECEVSNR